MSTPTSTLTPIETIERSAATAQCAVSLRGVSKSYGDSTVVRDLDLDIAAGEFFSLLGPSGCGKTTTLRMIGGFIDPTHGRCRCTARTSPTCRRTGATSTRSSRATRSSTTSSIWEQRRVRAASPQGCQGRDNRARRRDARTGAAHRSRQGQAERPVRWPAAARRPRAGAGQPPVGAAARRAARRAGSEAAQGDAGGAQAHPARGRHHVRVRHARPGGSADDVRPHRRDERRHGAPVRHARGHL